MKLRRLDMTMLRAIESVESLRKHSSLKELRIAECPRQPLEKLEFLRDAPFGDADED